MQLAGVLRELGGRAEGGAEGLGPEGGGALRQLALESRNPDSTVKVLWGSDSRDEMMEGWFDYRVKMPDVVHPPTLKSSSQPRQ